MPTADKRHRVDALIRRCYAGLDAGALLQEVLRRLGTVMTVDAAFVATVDPATMLFTSAVADEPLVEVAPQFLANELRAADVNRFRDLALESFPVGSLDTATGGARPDSERYSAIMRPLGLGDELRAALRTGETCWGVMCLHRQDGASGFDLRDIRLVARLAPHIGEGLRRASLAAGFRSPSSSTGHGVIVLDDDGSVVSMNDAAERLVAEMRETDWPASAPVPLPVLSAATAAGSASPEATAACRLRTATGTWVSVQASRLHGAPAAQTVVVLEPAQAAHLTSLVLQAHAVTGAQARVVALVLRGYSTQQIVNELRISSHTVQEHLKSVFDKFDVRSRRELAATLLHSSRTPPT